MSAEILDGKLLSQQAEDAVRARVEKLAARKVVPGLLVILVGDNQASQTYVANKEKACTRLGIFSQTLRLPKDCTQLELEKKILEANTDPRFHGILVQLPLPEGLNEKQALALISPDKDVDGFHAVNVGKLLLGEDCTEACTPKGILFMLHASGISLDGKNAVIIGRSNIVGKPMAAMLLRENATVTVCHSHTANLPAYTRGADLLIAAVGKPGFVTADMVKPGAAVIDVGINRVDGYLCGDVRFDEVKEVAGWITPVPGGVGKMTIAMLMDNTVTAAERQLSE